MNLVKIKVDTTSNKTADATGMIIRQNNQFRIVYFPKLVDNSKNRDECIGGCLVCQKKTKNQNWEDMNEISVKDVKAGEWTKFNLELGEMLNLIRYANKLKEIYDNDKSLKRIKQKHLLVLDDNLEQNEIEQFNEFAKDNPDAIANLGKLLNSKLDYNKILESINDNPNIIDDISENLDNDKSLKLYNSLKLKFINPDYLRNNFGVDNEEYWQKLFTENPNILFSIIPSVGQIICKKPYMGGKAINNIGGTLSDFFFKCGTRNVSIIEIKKPTTKLIDGKYRNEVFSPSEELSSAIVQLRKQKDVLLKEYYIKKANSEKQGIKFDAYDPKTYLIIGNSENLKENELESFELFRNGLKDIEIITFNEIVDKLVLISENLSH
mgnify:FL=1